MEQYINKLNDDELTEIGKLISNRVNTTLKNYFFEQDGRCVAEYRISNNPLKLNKNGQSQIYKLDLTLRDFYVEGLADNVYSIKFEKFLNKYYGYMIKRFGRDYAKDCYLFNRENAKEYVSFLIKSIEQKMSSLTGKELEECKEQIKELKQDYKIRMARIKFILNSHLISNAKKQLD